jgi:hypothetical protein
VVIIPYKGKAGSGKNEVKTHPVGRQNNGHF